MNRMGEIKSVNRANEGGMEVEEHGREGLQMKQRNWC